MVRKSGGNSYGAPATLPFADDDISPVMPVILYQRSSETFPLLPEQARRKEVSTSSFLQVLGGGLLLGVFLFMAYHTYMHLTLCPWDPFDKEREAEERQKLHMFWGNVETCTCTTYATREYTAQLMNLPITWEHPLDACRVTPLEIHGISHLPTTCEEKAPGVVTGRWEVDQNEPDCVTYWDAYNDKGCTSPRSGKKYITLKLENLPEKSDWRIFCATTPAHFDHVQFPGAQVCIDSIWGVYGQWELDDSNC